MTDEVFDEALKASRDIVLCYALDAAKEHADKQTADLAEHGLDEPHYVVVEYDPGDDPPGPTTRKRLYVVNVDGLADLGSRCNVSVVYESGYQL